MGNAPPPLDELEAALIKRAQAGSTAAFDQLVRRHQSHVRAFLRRMMADKTCADDLAQETFIKAWQNIGQWRGGWSLKSWLKPNAGPTQSFRSWLYSIASNTAKDYWRSNLRSQTRETAWAADRDGEPDPAAALGAKLDLDTIMQALSPDQRLVVGLCYGAGMSHSEAAEVLNMPIGTVKSHALRGRDRALARLEDLTPQAPQSTLMPRRNAS